MDTVEDYIQVQIETLQALVNSMEEHRAEAISRETLDELIADREASLKNRSWLVTSDFHTGVQTHTTPIISIIRRDIERNKYYYNYNIIAKKVR